MNIANNTVVTMHYTVSTTDGTQIDSSRDGEPMVHLQGSQYLIQGLENALTDKVKGDSFVVAVTSEEAYGERHEQLVSNVPKAMFGDNDVKVGMTFRANTDDGEQTVMIIDETEDEVVVDGNHPLAGMDLSFDVEILDVRAATEDEIEHGHAHAPGGCGHSH